MAEAQKKPVSDDGEKQAAPQTPPASTFTHAELIENASVFGVPGHAVAGAIDGEKQNLTRDEAEAAINKFFGR